MTDTDDVEAEILRTLKAHIDPSRTAEFIGRLARRMHEDQVLLNRLAGYTAKPCPERVDGVLGFPIPTSTPCSLTEGHDGPHTYTITWRTK